MFNQFYEKLKSFMKNNYKTLIFGILLYFILSYPIPYYIFTGGGTININDRVVIENGYSSKGSLNFAYVSELKGNVTTYLLSYLMNWDRAKISDYQYNEDESMEDILYRDKISLAQANQAAVMVAYQKAGKEVEVSAKHYVVTYLFDFSNTSLKIGDELLSLDGEKIEEIDSYLEKIQNFDVGSVHEVEVLRKGKVEKASVEVIIYEDRKLTGISIATLYDFETEPSLSLKFKASESGPSGGLMLALAIYDKLTPIDLTNGKKIVGTGTIDNIGNIGPIGGVKYKLKGAVQAKADIFLVPREENYEECLKWKEKYKYKIEIVPVNTLDEAIEYLKENKNKG